MKNVQIPYELFAWLVRYHLVENDACLNEIRRGEQKLDSLERYELYVKYKTAPTQEEREKPDRNIWENEECWTTSVGSFTLMIIEGACYAPVDSGQRERCDLMIIQPEWGTRNVNKYFYESEARRSVALNEIFGDVELSAAEIQTLIWLARWEACTVENVISTIRKAMAAEAKRREQSLRP